MTWRAVSARPCRGSSSISSPAAAPAAAPGPAAPAAGAAAPASGHHANLADSKNGCFDARGSHRGGRTPPPDATAAAPWSSSSSPKSPHASSPAISVELPSRALGVCGVVHVRTFCLLRRAGGTCRF